MGYVKLADDDSPLMAGGENRQRQTVGWNGMTLQLPAGWQPVVILNNYLLFEDRYQPVLELKWQQIKGALSPERILKQLRKTVGRKESVDKWIPPGHWQDTLARFNWLGFQWQDGQKSGRGILFYCSHCNQATLLQFYMDHPERDDSCLYLLQTLQDHPAGDMQQWSIYDISFNLPVTAVLQSQEFLTGSYRISFQLDKLFLSLLRFKPAQILLADIGLSEFGNRLLKNGEQPVAGEEDPWLACWRKQGNRWQRFKTKLRRQQADHFLCLRHIPEKNVILGVQAKSNQSIDEAAILNILHNFQAY